MTCAMLYLLTKSAGSDLLGSCNRPKSYEEAMLDDIQQNFAKCCSLPDNPGCMDTIIVFGRMRIFSCTVGASLSIHDRTHTRSHGIHA